MYHIAQHPLHEGRDEALLAQAHTEHKIRCSLGLLMPSGAHKMRSQSQPSQLMVHLGHTGISSSLYQYESSEKVPGEKEPPPAVYYAPVKTRIEPCCISVELLQGRFVGRLKDTL